MTWVVHNVTGDGNCMYRCIWRMVKGHPAIAAELLLENVDDEEKTVTELREYVALMLRNVEKYLSCKIFGQMVQNLLELRRSGVEGLEEMYPLLSHAGPNDASLSVGTVCMRIADAVEENPIYASDVEVAVMRDAFRDAGCDLLVVTAGIDVDEQLQKMLPHVQGDEVGILVNVSNIHYKVASFFGSFIISKQAILDFLDNQK